MRRQHVSESDRLHLVCCRANNKDDCTWAPCPANVDCYTPAELREFVAEDAHRVDQAVAIFTGTNDA